MTCAICLEAFYNSPDSENRSETSNSETPLVVATHCGHVFHYNCLSRTRRAPNRNYIHCPVCRSRVFQNSLLKLHNDWKCDCPTPLSPRSSEPSTSDNAWETELITLLETIKVAGRPTEGLISSLNRMIDLSTGAPHNFLSKIKKAINDLTNQVLHETKAKDEAKVALQNTIFEKESILSNNQHLIESLTHMNESLTRELEGVNDRLRMAANTTNRMNILRTLNESNEFPTLESNIRRNLFLERVNQLDRGGWINLLKEMHSINLHNEQESRKYKREVEKLKKEKEEEAKEYSELMQTCRRLESRHRQIQDETQLERVTPHKSSSSTITTPTQDRNYVTPVSRINPEQIDDASDTVSIYSRASPTRHIPSSSNQPTTSNANGSKKNINANPFIRAKVPLPDPDSLFQNGTSIINNNRPSTSNSISSREAALFNSSTSNSSSNNNRGDRNYLIGRMFAQPGKKFRTTVRRPGMDDD